MSLPANVIQYKKLKRAKTEGDGEAHSLDMFAFLAYGNKNKSLSYNGGAVGLIDGVDDGYGGRRGGVPAKMEVRVKSGSSGLVMLGAVVLELLLCDAPRRVVQASACSSSRTPHRQESAYPPGPRGGLSGH